MHPRHKALLSPSAAPKMSLMDRLRIEARKLSWGAGPLSQFETGAKTHGELEKRLLDGDRANGGGWMSR